MVNLLNIGNTNTTLCRYNGDSIREICSTKTVDLKDLIRELLSNDKPVAVVSVVPEKNNMFSSFKNLFWLDTTVKTTLDLSGIDRSTFGADRLANAIALSSFENLPAICIDYGTAITFEVVDENNKLRGGAILPGRKLMNSSLSNSTAQLPNIDLQNTIPKHIGTNTEDSIRVGVNGGICGMVKEVVSVIEKDIGKECVKVATGGDAPFFRGIISGIKTEKYYTFRGLIKAWKMNQ